jgi:hypothetical protein
MERIKGEKVWDKNRNKKAGKKKRGKKEWKKENETRDGEEEKNKPGKMSSIPEYSQFPHAFFATHILKY